MNKRLTELLSLSFFFLTRCSISICFNEVYLVNKVSNVDRIWGIIERPIENINWWAGVRLKGLEYIKECELYSLVDGKIWVFNVLFCLKQINGNSIPVIYSSL